MGTGLTSHLISINTGCVWNTNAPHHMLQMVMNNASIVDRLGDVQHLVIRANRTFTKHRKSLINITSTSLQLHHHYSTGIRVNPARDCTYKFHAYQIHKSLQLMSLMEIER